MTHPRYWCHMEQKQGGGGVETENANLPAFSRVDGAKAAGREPALAFAALPPAEPLPRLPTLRLPAQHSGQQISSS